MTQEEKQLLLQVLSAMFPYGVKVQHQHPDYLDEIQTIEHISRQYGEIETESVLGFVDDFKPYLRSMNKMTEEEKKIMRSCGFELIPYDTGYTGFANIENCIDEVSFRFMEEFLNAHHFDYRNLIERGLAIAVTEKNNPYKE